MKFRDRNKSESDKTQGKKQNELQLSQGQKRNESDGLKTEKSHKAQKLEQNKRSTQRNEELFQAPSPVKNSRQHDMEKARNSTQKEVEEVEYPLTEESEMLVDDKFDDDNVKGKTARDEFQFSGKTKIFPLHDCSQTSYSDIEVDSDAESLVSSQSLPLERGGYSMLSIKKFLKSTKGARNVKLESAFPDLQLFIDSVKNFQKSSESAGEKIFTDQERFRLKLVLKVRRQLEDGEYV